MLIHPQFDPAAIRIGSFAIHWYGLMYLMAFAQFLLLGRFTYSSAALPGFRLDLQRSGGSPLCWGSWCCAWWALRLHLILYARLLLS